MAEVDTVQIPTITEPTAGETVATLSKLIKTVGLPTDPKSSATDGTSVTIEAALKQISFTLQASENLLTTINDSMNDVEAGIESTEPAKVAGTTPRITASKATPSSNGVYAAGDHIANSATGASVTPITFTNAARVSGGSARLTGCRCVHSCASGTIVLCHFLLWVFRPASNIPFAAGSYPADNAAINISIAAMKEVVGLFEFLSTDWTNQAGLATAVGDTLYQGVPLRPAPSGRQRPYAPFNLASIPGSDLLAVMQVQNTWNPGNVVNTFDFALDDDQD